MFTPFSFVLHHICITDHIIFLVKWSNPALMSSHRYVEFDKNCRTILPQHSHQCCPSVHHCLLSFYLVRMVPLCSLHHSTISNTLSPCVNSVGKPVILHEMEAQMMSTVIWAIGKPFFNLFLVFVVLII